MVFNNQSVFGHLLHHEGANATYRPRANPVVFERGLGSELWDVEGNRYIDLCAGFGALPFGHAPPFLDEVLRQVSTTPRGAPAPLLTHGYSDVYASKAKVDLLRALKPTLPDHLRDGRVMLALGGAQAVEMALKTAMLATKGDTFIAFDGAYHGQDLGVLPVTSREDFRAPFHPWLAGAHVLRLTFGCDPTSLDVAWGQIKSSGRRLAGLITEPVQGRRGSFLPPPGWLERMRHWCTEHQCPLIFDEVFTGFGRCGRPFWASEVPADIVCLGKALGGGFPLSAIAGTETIMRAWPECSDESIHTGTFFGHPLSCLVAQRTLEEIARVNLVRVSLTTGHWLAEEMRRRFHGHPAVRETRGVGLMRAIDLGTPGAGAKLMDDLRSRGVIAICAGERGECLALTPALNIKPTILTEALDVIHDALPR